MKPEKKRILLSRIFNVLLSFFFFTRHRANLEIYIVTNFCEALILFSFFDDGALQACYRSAIFVIF